MGKASATNNNLAARMRRFTRDIRNGLARDVPPWVSPPPAKNVAPSADDPGAFRPLSRTSAVLLAAIQHLHQLRDQDLGPDDDDIALCAIADLEHLLDRIIGQP